MVGLLAKIGGHKAELFHLAAKLAADPDTPDARARVERCVAEIDAWLEELPEELRVITPKTQWRDGKKLHPIRIAGGQETFDKYLALFTGSGGSQGSAFKKKSRRRAARR